MGELVSLWKTTFLRSPHKAAATWPSSPWNFCLRTLARLFCGSLFLFSKVALWSSACIFPHFDGEAWREARFLPTILLDRFSLGRFCSARFPCLFLGSLASVDSSLVFGPFPPLNLLLMRVSCPASAGHVATNRHFFYRIKYPPFRLNSRGSQIKPQEVFPPPSEV